MTSPFANTGATYLERGLAIMPCGPGTKFPGRFTTDGWHVAYDWQKYCDRLPTRFETSCWDQWPDAGICLALGTSSAPAGLQLVAADIDTEEAAEVAAIRSVLPGSPVRKRGAKGETEFYLAPIEVPNRPYNNTLIEGTKRRMLDLLGHGRQTVLPPTMHPDTGTPYRWTTLDTLENFDVADLPVLPADIADQLSKALAPFGHVDAPTVGERGSATLDGEESVHRQLNDAALADLGAWVPALNLYKCRQVGGKYKAVAHWRPSSSGRPQSKRATNLAISSDGIKDCGDGRGYTPIDLVMAACGADLESAFRWLQERVAPVAPIMLTARVPVEDPAPVFTADDNPVLAKPEPRRGNLFGIVQANGDIVPVQPAREPDPDAGERPVELITGNSRNCLMPRHLCQPPGLIGSIVEWINDSDEGDGPQLALGATLAFLGSIMGRRYAHPSRGARTNVYCVGLAPTGFGKDHALTAIKELARYSGLDGYLGPGRWKSESAVRKILESKPTVVCLVDELGGVMRDILGKKASEHKAGIRDILLELFSAARSTYTGAEGASEKAVPIDNPNLCVYGATTPKDLWGNLNTGAAADGFLPRWLVFDMGTTRPTPKDATADVFAPPEHLRKALHAILDQSAARGNLAAAVGPPRAIRAEWGAGAQDYFKGMVAEANRIVDEARERHNESSEIIRSRSVEHAVKLSLIYAVSIDAKNPVITIAALEWAREVVEYSTAALIRGLEGRVADTDAQAQYLWTLNTIREAGADGMLEKDLMRLVRGKWDQRRHGDILGQLESAGEIWRGVRSTARGGPMAQRVGAWSESEREAV